MGCITSRLVEKVAWVKELLTECLAPYQWQSFFRSVSSYLLRLFNTVRNGIGRRLVVIPKC